MTSGKVDVIQQVRYRMYWHMRLRHPSKTKHDGSKKTVVRRALNKFMKHSVLAVLNKAVSSPSSIDQADSGGEILAYGRTAVHPRVL